MKKILFPLFSFYLHRHDGKEVLLPIFQRERLKLITFLGSGAFGEVFEGSALDILGDGTGEARVAVKVSLIQGIFLGRGERPGGVSHILPSMINDSLCYKLLKSLLLIGYQQICH